MRWVVTLVGLAAGCGRLNFDSHDSPPGDGDTTSGLIVTEPGDNAEVGPAVRVKGSCVVSNGEIEIHGTGVGGLPSTSCVGSAFDLSVDLTAGFGDKQLIVIQGSDSVTRNLRRVPQRPEPFTAKSGSTITAGPATSCDLVISNPPGLSAGQLLVGMIYTDGGLGASISTPGFTRLTLDSGVAVAFFKVVGFTEPSEYTFTIVAGAAQTDTCASGGVLVGIRNVDVSNPIDDDSASFDTGNALVAPSVTASFPTTIVAVFGSNGGSAIAPPIGMDADPDPMPNGSFAISPGGDGNALITWQAVDAGATGTRATQIGSPRGTAAGLIALRPL